MLIVWIAVFVVSLVVLVRGAGLVLASSERIGLAVGLSPFIVGVVVIGFGTSLPELASSIAAVWSNAHEIVAANVIGSNIANILLIAGLAAIVSGRLTVGKNLADLDIPLLAISTAFLITVAYDGMITRAESLFLILAFVVYLLYTALFEDDLHSPLESLVDEQPQAKLSFRDIAFFIAGLAMLIAGAKFLIDAVNQVATILSMSVGLISLVVVAVGTSLPELVVSIRAGLQGKADVALGNIFGSNVFNALFVIGFPGLFAALPVDPQTLAIGVPVMAGVTILFIISTLSNRFHNYEGAMYILLYVLFLGKLSGVV